MTVLIPPFAGTTTSPAFCSKFPISGLRYTGHIRGSGETFGKTPVMAQWETKDPPQDSFLYARSKVQAFLRSYIDFMCMDGVVTTTACPALDSRTSDVVTEQASGRICVAFTHLRSANVT